MNNFDIYLTNNEIQQIENDIFELSNKKLNEKNKLTKNVIKRTDVERKNKNKNKKEPLKIQYNENNTSIIEAGIDEAGRGPLFGRVYSACVILPNNTDEFNHSIIKDSKRFSSKRKLLDVYDYIRENAVDYKVWYEDEKTIDNINIRRATHKCMNEAINNMKIKPDYLLVDGRDFISQQNPFIPFICIEGGDNKYTSIASASILAKVERDKYIEDLCNNYPYLEEKYGIAKNKGYGTKKHRDAIKEYGITQWHRKTFGICKEYSQFE